MAEIIDGSKNQIESLAEAQVKSERSENQGIGKFTDAEAQKFFVTPTKESEKVLVRNRVFQDNIPVKFIGPGVPGKYPGMEGEQKTVLVEWEENGTKCIGTIFFHQMISETEIIK